MKAAAHAMHLKTALGSRRLGPLKGFRCYRAYPPDERPITEICLVSEYSESSTTECSESRLPRRLRPARPFQLH